jgi:hypothetical protein
MIKSGLEGVSKENRVVALRGLQDLGWIGHGGLADFEESYSLTKEGRRIVANRPELRDLEKNVQGHITALREVDGGTNGPRKDALKRLIEIECEMSAWDSALLHCYELRSLQSAPRILMVLRSHCISKEESSLRRTVGTKPSNHI